MSEHLRENNEIEEILQIANRFPTFGRFWTRHPSDSFASTFPFDVSQNGGDVAA
jgi:hypothetical protein